MATSKNSQYVCNHVKKRKNDLVQVLGGKCCICGFNSFIEALEFHHINPQEKEFGITASNAITKSLDKQLIELKKCALVCANCHRGIHGGYLQLPDDVYSLYNEDMANKLVQENYDLRYGKKRHCERCGKVIESKDAKFCADCHILMVRKVPDRPDRESLKNMIRNMPFTHIGKQFQVTDNTIRKWCNQYQLPTKKKEINIISDEDWEKI